jgi:hypothetical protein
MLSSVFAIIGGPRIEASWLASTTANFPPDFAWMKSSALRTHRKGPRESAIAAFHWASAANALAVSRGNFIKSTTPPVRPAESAIWTSNSGSLGMSVSSTIALP